MLFFCENSGYNYVLRKPSRFLFKFFSAYFQIFWKILNICWKGDKFVYIFQRKFRVNIQSFKKYVTRKFKIKNFYKSAKKNRNGFSGLNFCKNGVWGVYFDMDLENRFFILY